MNKITKIWVLWVALLTLTTALFTKAADATKKVSLVLTDWQNTCAWSDFNLWSKTVSASSQAVTPDNKDLTCTILKSSAQHIEVWLENLSNWTESIAASQFTWVISNIRMTWSLTTWITPTFNMWQTKNVYSKWTGQVWIWTWNLKIDGIIPAWKPAGTYTGNLNISVVAGYGS